MITTNKEISYLYEPVQLPANMRIQRSTFKGVMAYTHQYSALKIWGYLSKQQTPYQTGDGGEDESAAQGPGHREVIPCDTPISSYTRQIATTTCRKV